MVVVNARRTGSGAAIVDVVALATPPPLGPLGLQLTDLDGDGAADLLIEHAGGVDLAWSRDGTIDLHGRVALPVPPGAGAAVSATPLQADPDDALELAVLTDTAGVWLADRAGDGFVLGGSPVARLGGERLRAADLDADGLLDLVIEAGGGYETLRARSHLERP
jgi:hypothetical protein